MKFEIETWNIRKIITLYEQENLNLSPPYQRGDIWSTAAKKKLIGSIKISYPLPLFFIYKGENDNYEMVDGQQRTRAILGYHSNFYSDENKITIENTDHDLFYNQYKLAICILSEANQSEIIDFYYRVNKFGTKLNRPEILRAQFSSLPQQQLVERIADNEDLVSLKLFSESSLNRLNDTDLVAELLTLQLFGNTDKKNAVDKKFYEDVNFTEENARDLEERFNEILVHLQRFNILYPLSKTRYKQRNDIYTLYGFLKMHLHLASETLDHIYKILVLIGEDISPSNDKCFSFKEYADNCVSQSNSKRARDERSAFLDNIFTNKDPKPLEKDEKDSGANLYIIDTLKFYNLTNEDLVNQETYYLINIDTLQEVTKRFYFKK